VADRDSQQPYSGDERRTPVKNDLDPDGMDSETEADELEAGTDDSTDDSNDGIEADGADDHPDVGEARQSAADGKADPDTARRTDVRKH
jgi:hypothetical protein